MSKFFRAFSWIYFLAFVIELISSPSGASAYSVIRFGAKGDGRTDSTSAFLQAWSIACRSIGPTTFSVPRGTFLIKSITFIGPCRNRVQFAIHGRLVAPNNFYQIGNLGHWIEFYKVSRLSIIGGTIDARGAGFWTCRRRGQNCPQGARSISLQWCNDVVIRGLTSYNSQIMHISINHSNNVKIQNVKINAPSGSPNTDGIHVEYSMGVTVSQSTIRTGDDCISLGQGSMNVWVEEIGCGPGHGISIGSLGNSLNEGGVQNVTVQNSIFTKTQNGVRLKSWARPSGGYATNIVFRNLIMRNVGNPIIIDQKYCPSNQCPHGSSGVRFSKVVFQNIKGTSSTQTAMTFRCSPSNPCSGIKLEDVRLTFVDRLRRPALAYCENARGSSAGQVFPKSCL